MSDPYEPHISPDRLEKAERIRDFMLGPARLIADPNVTLTKLSELLIEAGIPLDRSVTIVRVLHAEYTAVGRIWERGKGARDYKLSTSSAGGGYSRSPAARAHETGEWVILDILNTPNDAYAIIPELKAEGYTHYICAPVLLANEMANGFMFASKSASGFSPEDIALLRMVFPAIAACQEILVMHRILRELVKMYVGAEPHRRILAGDVRRGEVIHIQSTIMFADMRGFTDLTAGISAEAATALLNDYYDCVVPFVEANGGEVLKFIGDGIMAIFRSEEAGRNAACVSALRASTRALAAVRARNADPRTAPNFEIGIGLHFGEAAFGNVGSGARLDYTIIGRDVNIAARVAGLCGVLKRHLLVTSDYRAAFDDSRFRSLGHHALKGIGPDVEIFEARQ